MRRWGMMWKSTFLLFLMIGVMHADEKVRFNRDIRPILSDNCFYCHGNDESNRKADLRLDSAEGAKEAIVPGNANASELVARILSNDPDDLMPPPETEQELSSTERELLQRWIDQGAEYEEHWAWTPLTRPESAKTIDTFLEHRWKQEKTTPAPAATAREQLRRLSFDLRGLPPTADEVAAFEENPSDTAFAKFRDQWMNSLAYAEHQAVRWLDLVRWADTSGFVSDEPIASGAYRAWIVNSIHQNQPFDEFSLHQLAGDLVPNANDDTLIASGYNRIVNTNCEAGAIETEQLYKLKGEHVRALGTVWLGLTTGCAECHDHKFDPISAKDYYSLAAYFDDLIEAGVYTPGDRRNPIHYVHEEKTSTERDAELVGKIEMLTGKILRNDQTLDAKQSAWEKSVTAELGDTKNRTDFVWMNAQLSGARVIEGEFRPSKKDGRTTRFTQAKDGEFTRYHAAELMTGDMNHGSYKTDDQKDAFYADVWIDPKNPPTMLGLQVLHGDYGRLGWEPSNYETYYWGDARKQLDKEHSWCDPKLVKRLGDLPKETGWVRLRVPFAEMAKGVKYESVGMGFLQIGGTIHWADSGLELRQDKTTRLRLAETAIRKWAEIPVNRQTFQNKITAVEKAVLTKSKDRTAQQRDLVWRAFREWAQPELLATLRTMESELYALRSDAMPVLVSRGGEPKITQVLNRGDYQDTSGPIVEPAIPEVFGKAKGTTRLDLANWLFSTDNPLTARVFVNRLWQQFYGRGLSKTLEDVGTQGDWPSHPDLLDWLAVEFRESGWDRNHMVKLLTSTKAYRMSSKPSVELVENDPSNRLHARQSRFRLPAEVIRDSALLAAGLLESTIEVPVNSFFPYQPSPYWTRSNKIMFGSRKMPWETSSGTGQYQRSLYTFWKRQNIHPTMLAFDAPTRQECTAERNITNTPGQALALLNDPILIEAARGLAQEILKADLSDAQRIEQAFKRVLQRQPNRDEIDVLVSLLATQRSVYSTDLEAARSLISIGQSPQPDTSSTAEHAAWIAVTRAILNLHESVTRS